MSNKVVTFTCPRCGHTWYRDRASLDRQDQEVYKGRVPTKTYRDPCPKCGSYAVVEVEE
ncbi:MAG TPA: hypothetical protein VM537_11330 [Anaerolineae bacterium]|nr:hypothetical protein [Anaerolineae bacterium]